MPTVLSSDAVPGPESAGNGPEGPGQSTDPRRGHPTGDLAERDPSTTRTGSRVRSEEHTSELQSLMRISYAVFCLKKKKTKSITSTSNTVTLITLRDLTPHTIH